MVKSLVLHVGDPKTGTSSIQKVLFERRWTCDSVALDYPEILSSMALANALRAGAKPGEADEVFEPYAFWLDQSTADVAVISAEQFSSVEPRKVDRAFRKYFPDLAPSVRVVAYARPHAGRLLSAYVQRVKAGQMGKDLDRFFADLTKSRVLAMHARFSRWREVFGDRFVLRPMLRAEMKGGDVVADFLDVVLQGAPFALTGSTEANVSLPAEALAGLKAVQAILRRAEIKGGRLHAIGDHLNALVTGQPGLGGTKLTLNAAMAARLAEAVMPDAMALDRDFFGKPIMVPALEAAASTVDDKGSSTELTDHFRPRQIVLLKRAARNLAEEMRSSKGLWVKAHKRDKGRKPQFLDNAKLSSKAPEAIDKTEALLHEIGEILCRACTNEA